MAKEAKTNPGGRNIGKWLGIVWTEYPMLLTSDPLTQQERLKAVADKVHGWAKDAGYDFPVSADMVVKWIKDKKKKDAEQDEEPPAKRTPETQGLSFVQPEPVASETTAASEPTSNGKPVSEEGELTVMLRQAVRLLGKESVKRIVDGL